MPETLELSVIVPVRDEAEAVGPLAREIADALAGRAFEMIFVDDGSQDETHARLAALKSQIKALRVLRHARQAGQSRAIRSGAERARGRVLAMLDGDGQNDPADLPGLYRQLTRTAAPEGLALVIGERARRGTGWREQAAAATGEAMRRFFLKDETRDSACGIKVIGRETFLALPYFDHMHRFLPALVRAEGLAVETRPVSDRPRMAGQSKYTVPGRLAADLADLRAVAWLARRRRPHGPVEEA